jgi:hypothetical protein
VKTCVRLAYKRLRLRGVGTRRSLRRMMVRGVGCEFHEEAVVPKGEWGRLRWELEMGAMDCFVGR